MAGIWVCGADKRINCPLLLTNKSWILDISIEEKTLAIIIFFQLTHNKEWGFHNARVNTVAWSPDNKLVASGSLDTTIIIWSLQSPAKHTIIKSKTSFFYRCIYCYSYNSLFKEFKILKLITSIMYFLLLQTHILKAKSPDWPGSAITH